MLQFRRVSGRDLPDEGLREDTVVVEGGRRLPAGWGPRKRCSRRKQAPGRAFGALQEVAVQQLPPPRAGKP